MSEFTVVLPEKFNQLPVNDSIRKNRKVKHYDSSMILLAINNSGSIQTLIDARFYTTTNRSYCCLWSHLPDFTIKGGAFAGGYGYHKASTSLEFALGNAGITISPLAGRGDNVMESALIEIGQKMNDKYNLELTGFTVIIAYG